MPDGLIHRAFSFLRPTRARRGGTPQAVRESIQRELCEIDHSQELANAREQVSQRSRRVPSDVDGKPDRASQQERTRHAGTRAVDGGSSRWVARESAGASESLSQ